MDDEREIATTRALSAEGALERARARGRQPDLLDAHVALGRARLEADDPDGAESSLRTAVQQARVRDDPGRLGPALLWLARAQVRLGRGDRALLAYTEALPHLQRAGSDLAPEAAAELCALPRASGGAR